MVKNLPVMQETQVPSQGQDDPLEEEMATPLQYSCLENPMGRGALWATVQRVAKRRTQQPLTVSLSLHLGEGRGRVEARSF